MRSAAAKNIRTRATRTVRWPSSMTRRRAAAAQYYFVAAQQYYWPAPPRSLAHGGEAFGRLSGGTTTRPVPPTPPDGRHAAGGAGVPHVMFAVRICFRPAAFRPEPANPSAPGNPRTRDQHSHPTSSHQNKTTKLSVELRPLSRAAEG